MSIDEILNDPIIAEEYTCIATGCGGDGSMKTIIKRVLELSRLSEQPAKDERYKRGYDDGFDAAKADQPVECAECKTQWIIRPKDFVCGDCARKHYQSPAREVSLDWQPIETAPKDGTEVDLWDKNGFRLADCRWDSANSVWLREGPYVDDGDISHWMHKPKPPTTKTDIEGDAS